MFNPSFRKGMSVAPQVFRNITEEKMAAPNNAYYVLTQAHAGLPNSVTISNLGDVDVLTEGTITAETLVSTVNIGAAPLAVTSTTAVTNLNADLLDGHHYSEINQELTGFIKIWSGTIANIPAGYQLCDGTNGTQDLRDVFVVGASADDAGTAKTCITGSLTKSGGAITHEHTGSTSIDDHTAHTHAYGTIAVANHASHTHVVSGSTAAYSIPCLRLTYCGCVCGAPYGHSHSVSITSQGPSATLTHTVSGSTDNPSATLTHNGTITVNSCTTLPPYYALAYVQKM